MDVRDYEGMAIPPQVVVVERGPVSNFATAITDTNPVFHDADAASAAGFGTVPTPPTYPFVMHAFGAHTELQPTASEDPDPVQGIVRTLMASGGLLLHGEQEFTYRRPVLVGDRVRSSGVIEDVSVREAGEPPSRTTTVVVVRTDWVDDRTGEPVCSSRMTLVHRR